MTTTESGPDQDRAWRCASWYAAAHMDPIGTMGAYAGYLLVDVALPWPVDIGALDDVRDATDALGGSRLRVQARVPAGPRRIALYRFPEPGAPTMVGLEIEVGDAPGAVSAAVVELLAGRGEPVPADHHEVLLCTHGRRDVCCGARGTTLQLELAAGADGGGTGLGVADLDVRRTSHTGGHRFAPTAIVLPEATGWAYLDADVLGRVVRREGPFAAVAPHYRGWSGLSSPALQAVERAVLTEVGWEGLARPRQGLRADDGTWVLETGGRRWQAEVGPGRRIPRPACGEAPSASGKAETELVVTGLVSGLGPAA